MENSAWDYEVFVCGRQKGSKSLPGHHQSSVALLSKTVFPYHLFNQSIPSCQSVRP